MKLRLNKKRSGRRGYTLLEIMFSILILGVGMAAVASLFPFATHIQQNTMHELMSQQTRANIVTLLVNKGMDQTVINDSTKHEVPTGMTYQTNTTRLALAAGAVAANDPTDAANELNLIWPLQDRSYPTTTPDLTRRSIYWEPLFIKDGNEWHIHVVIMRRRLSIRPGLTAEDVIPTLQATPLTRKAGGADRDYNFEADRWLVGTAALLNRFKVGDKVVDHLGNLHDITDKAYDEAAGNGQNAVPFAIEVSGNLSADANWTLWHIAVNAATNTQRGEILNIVTLGNEVLK